MQDAAAVEAPDRKPFPIPLVTLVRASVPTLAEASLATGSAVLLILSFPDYDLWPLAWAALVPAIRGELAGAFGWLAESH